MALDLLSAHLEGMVAQIEAVAADLEQVAVAAIALAEVDLDHATAIRRELSFASRLAGQARDVLTEAARRTVSAGADRPSDNSKDRARTTP